MCTKKELEFSLFLIYHLAEKWKKNPSEVYTILNDTHILDDYILVCYDMLHTLGTEYLIEDITEFARERSIGMIVYHGTTMELEKPNVMYSKDYLDFGKGFYVTTYREQAEKWALRKGVRRQTQAYINVYEMADDLTPFNILAFEKENEKWLDFVCACRKGDKGYQNYDVIIGGVANDDVFKTVDMYFRGLWSKEKALTELRYYKMNNQICIVDQTVLEQILTFQKSYKVELTNDQ